MVCMDIEGKRDYLRGCFACEEDVRNPFYAVSLAVRGPMGKVAFSVKADNLCNKDFKKIERKLLDVPAELDSDIGYAISTVTGSCYERGGAVQVYSGVCDVHGDYRFLDRVVVLEKFPGILEDLEGTYLTVGDCFGWDEKNKNGDWEKAGWPQAIFMAVIEKIRAEKP